MEFLMDRGSKEFANCLPTIKFIRFINNIFDIMNTKHINTKNIFKSSLTSDTKSEVFSYFDNAIEYLKSLKITPDKTVLESKKKSGFRGLIINMVDLKLIHHELIESNLMKSLLTFRFSQDPLESMFGRIRSLNGFNDNNPTVEQFCSAYRKLMVHNEVSSSVLSNCLDDLHTLYVSSRRPKSVSVEDLANCNQLNRDVQEQVKRIEQIDESNDLVDTLEGTKYSVKKLKIVVV